MASFTEMSTAELVQALQAKGFKVTLDPPLEEADSDPNTPTEDDITLCSKPALPTTMELPELLTLLRKFKNHANVRYPAKPEVVCVDKVVMACRSKSSVIKKRQDMAIEMGIAQLLTDVLTGVHFEDRETCLRTSQCITGVASKNADAAKAFREAGCGAALEAIIEKHAARETKDMKAALDHVNSE